MRAELETSRESAHIALACVAVTFTLTCATNFGVGAALWSTRGWRAWQPMVRGRRAFVALQSLGWALAAASIACVIAALAFARERSGMGRVVTCALSWASLGCGVAGEAAVGASLAFFDERRARGPRNGPARVGVGWKLVRVVQMLTVMHVLHAPHAAIVAILGTAYALGRWRTLAAVVVLYASTYASRSHQRKLERGERKWDDFQAWTAKLVAGAAESWHGAVTIVHDDGSVGNSVDARARDETRTPIVFSYHPHSLIPAGAVWFWMLPAFGERFASLKPVTLAASALFRAPVVRELAGWLGVRSVSGDVFRSTLREHGAVVVCPGGQHEMQEHVGGLRERRIVLCTKHKGFIRIAIEERALLVPVVTFGESSSWSNLLRHPGRYVYRRFRAATPILAVGYLGVLPIPRRVPITFVIGEPMSLPEPDENGVAKEVDVDRVHALYYAEVARLFEKHKADAGWEHLHLVLKED